MDSVVSFALEMLRSKRVPLAVSVNPKMISAGR